MFYFTTTIETSLESSFKNANTFHFSRTRCIVTAVGQGSRRARAPPPEGWGEASSIRLLQGSIFPAWTSLLKQHFENFSLKDKYCHFSVRLISWDKLVHFHNFSPNTIIVPEGREHSNKSLLTGALRPQCTLGGAKWRRRFFSTDG